MYQSDDSNSWFDRLCDDPILSILNYQLILQKPMNADNDYWNEHELNSVLVGFYDEIKGIG
jgi:hypothetical protein